MREGSGRIRTVTDPALLITPKETFVPTVLALEAVVAVLAEEPGYPAFVVVDHGDNASQFPRSPQCRRRRHRAADTPLEDRARPHGRRDIHSGSPYGQDYVVT